MYYCGMRAFTASFPPLWFFIVNPFGVRCDYYPNKYEVPVNESIHGLKHEKKDNEKRLITTFVKVVLLYLKNISQHNVK